VSQLDRWADKPWFVSASWDGSVKVWMLDDGRLLRDLVRSEGRHRIDVVSAGDGTAIAAGPLALTIWDLARAKAIHELGHSATTRIRQASDPARIVMVKLDGRVSTTDEVHGTRQVGLHGAQLVALAMVGGGRYALTGAGDGTVVRWDLDAAREDDRFRMHEGAITDIVAIQATDTVVSESCDGTVKCWSWRNPTQVVTLAMDGIAVEAVAVDPGGARVAAAVGATLRIWSLPLGQPLGSCVLWDRLTALLMPATDLLVAGDVSGNLYGLRFGHGRLDG
jgi:WD40 repeat protein